MKAITRNIKLGLVRRLPNMRLGTALFFVVVISLALAAIVTHIQLAASKTERALLETENTACRLLVALTSQSFLAGAKDDESEVKEGQSETKDGQDGISNHEVAAASAPPSPLWGLRRWPAGSEIFLATRGQESFVVKRTPSETLEFTKFEPREFFARAMGTLTNVEWMFADAVNSTETSLATQESAEARSIGPSALHSATVVLPGTNTMLRRYFLISASGIFGEDIFYAIAVSLAAIGCLSVFCGARCFGSLALRKKEEQEQEQVASFICNQDFFVQRILLSLNSELMEYQSIILLAVDRSFSSHSERRDAVVQAISETLNALCQHGPLAAHIAPENSDGGRNENSSENNGENRLNNGRILFGFHCPNFDKAKAIQFAEMCRVKIETHPQLALHRPAITLAAAVSEFHRKSRAAANSETILRNMLAATFGAIETAEKDGGGTTIFARAFSLESEDEA
jgi:hypothetical protein